jgi:endonuclease YncB( thermonuclease family)
MQRQSLFMKRMALPSPASILAAAFLPLIACNAAAPAPCKLVDIGTATVAGVRDGRTLLLADGRELRLAAIEAADSGRDALQQLVGGQSVRLEQLGTAADRYGRLVVFVYAENTEQSVQQAMVTQGQARVSGRIGNKACADVLLGAEKAARKARRGLWADPNFAPLRPENVTRIGAARGQFALVEGKVLSVRESGATIYLNFGRRWTKDFTVTILKRHRREFAAAGIDPKQLEGRPIRVRGWIEQRNGPVIEADAPEQIELVE